MDVKFFAIISQLAIVFGSNSISELIVDYFTHRNVKVVCLFHCTGKTSAINVVKALLNVSIGVSSVDLMDEIDGGASAQCLRHNPTLGVVLDVTCDSQNVLNYASYNQHFDGNTKWLLLQLDTVKEKYENIDFNESRSIMETINPNNGTKNEKIIESDPKLMKTLDKLNLSIDADIKVVFQKEQSEFIIYDVFNYGKIQGGDLIIEEIGSWNSHTGFSNVLNSLKYYKRWNFHDLKMRMILVVSPQPKDFNPEVFKLRDAVPIPGVVKILQTSSIIIHEVADLHNFRFKYTITDRWIGTYERNSTRVVTNSLYFKEQDISPVIRYLPQVCDRLSVVQTPVAAIETRYFYRIPTKGPGKLENQFLRPLSKGAWIGFIVVSVLCAILLVMSAAVEQRPSMFQYGVFSVIASVCQQFFEDCDDTVGQRVSEARKLTIFVTGVSCVLIYNYYTSSVVSWLLNGPPPSLNSLRELLESPLELIYEDVGYTRSWLQNPSFYFNKNNVKVEDDMRKKKVLNKKPGVPLLKSVEEGIALVKTGGYAYHTEVSSANDMISKTFTQSDLCELGSLQSIERTDVRTCLQRQSPFKEFFDWSFMRFRERGIISRIQNKMDSYSVSCEGSSPRALTLGGAAPVFMLLGAGFMLATFIMLVERYKYKIQNKI